MNYVLHLVVYLNIYIVLALSLNLVVGYCGLLTLAHAGYFAAGAYAYALLTTQAGWGFLPAAAAGAVLCSVLSLALSLAAWRLRGDFFVLVSLSVQALIFSAVYNWAATDAPVGSLRNLTNGPLGIAGIPRPAFGSWTASTPASMAILSSLMSVGVLLVMWRLSRSPWARMLIAIRDDELAARGLGKSARLARVQAFAISCAVAGVAGAVYASYVRYLDPSTASLDEGILMLSMALVGGLGNLRGPVVGAFLLIAIPEALRLVQLPEAQAANLRLCAYGLLLVVLMHLRPQGVAGVYRVE